MRRIVTAISAAALALSLVAQATPAAAVTGYDSAYAGESAFLTLARGATGSFTVFFANTGTATWLKGGTTQVDLAACLENKTTCNAQDASDAPFNSGWLSATRYATSTQTSVGPGQVGTFTYNVKVPASQAAGTYRFNGALVLASTGADIHNEGYYHDVTVPAAAAAPVLDSLDPDNGSTEGGENVVLTGTGFICSPSPTVLFGDNAADVLSCGPTSITVTTPAADSQGTSTVDVTVTQNPTSNALEFTYNDVTAPEFLSIDVEGQTVTLNFSEPVCINGLLDVDDDSGEDDIIVNVNGDTVDVDSDDAGDAGNGDLTSDAPLCGDGTAESFSLTIQNDGDNSVDIAEGDTVTVTLTDSGADTVEDEAGNSMARAHTESATATADEVPPAAPTAEATDDEVLELTFAENITCDPTDDNSGEEASGYVFTNDDGDSFSADSVECDSDSITLWFSDGTFVGTGGSLAFNADSHEVTDVSNNALESFDVEITPLEGTGDPIIISVTVRKTGLVNNADTGDTIEILFSEPMADTIESNDTAEIRVQDADGTVYDIMCDSDTFECDDTNEDSAEWWITIKFKVQCGDPTETSDVACVAGGDVAGIQWPATIIDIGNWFDSDERESDPVDLENSEDVTINASD